MKETTTYLNFLPYANDIYSLCKQLKFYNNAEYEKETGLGTGEWPGTRTSDLNLCSPFLYIHILTLLNQKLIMSNYKQLSMVCHLRLQEDEEKDFKHVDSTDTALIYLSPTNLNSGTNFFDDNQNVVASRS